MEKRSSMYLSGTVVDLVAQENQGERARFSTWHVDHDQAQNKTRNVVAFSVESKDER